MDDLTPELDAITDEMREVMRAWIADPDNAALKQRYQQLQDAYQRGFLEFKKRGLEEEARPGGLEAAHQQY